MSAVTGAAFTAVIYFGFNFYNYLVIPLCGKLQPLRIPDRAPRFEKLAWIDHIYITFSRLVTALFVYHCYLFTTSSYSGMNTSFDSDSVIACLIQMPLQLPMAFIIYDFFYTLFHWALHWEPIYPLIHKHHHRQMTPFRGNADAINVHPIEYVVGEYDHLFTMFLMTRIFGTGNVHALLFIVFIAIGGALASLNHTRFDIQLPYVFNVRAHDYHHRQPLCNFGQYIMLWDCVFGTFMPCEPRSSDAQADKLKKKVAAELEAAAEKEEAEAKKKAQ
eukprot:CAMPEP_0176435044 /NCGR_PEP_ID=MMETSP0127-20121128/17064_1 /TAXON_ID=938130 /ORGANISM="Platyophrya macrostoma, Strain WH" /LENGTH=274 /DNA_ID=CAMNT_0017817949 /DNA_START=42 /DNA_END=866 /DNA_ORIENTATION=-